jgi:hypothetical protein
MEVDTSPLTRQYVASLRILPCFQPVLYAPPLMRFWKLIPNRNGLFALFALQAIMRRPIRQWVFA